MMFAVRADRDSIFVQDPGILCVQGETTSDEDVILRVRCLNKPNEGVLISRGVKKTGALDALVNRYILPYVLDITDRSHLIYFTSVFCSQEYARKINDEYRYYHEKI